MAAKTSETVVHEFPILAPGSVTISLDSFHRMNAGLAGGQSYEHITAKRAFPLTAPAKCVLLIDSSDTTIGMIADTALLDESSRTILNSELELSYFVTRITGILSVKSSHGATTWEFETARGCRTVYVKDRSDIRLLSGGRVVFTDVNGLKFEIPDVEKLDDRGQALLDSES